MATHTQVSKWVLPSIWHASHSSAVSVRPVFQAHCQRNYNQSPSSAFVGLLRSDHPVSPSSQVLHAGLRNAVVGFLEFPSNGVNAVWGLSRQLCLAMLLAVSCTKAFGYPQKTLCRTAWLQVLPGWRVFSGSWRRLPVLHLAAPSRREIAARFQMIVDCRLRAGGWLPTTRLI